MRIPSSLFALALLAACSSASDKPTDTGATTAANNKPVAEAGDAVTQPADSPIVLSGALSTDPDGDALTFHWSFDHLPEGSTLDSREAPFAPNNTALAVGTSFSADIVGTYVVKLIVTDTKGADSEPDYVIVTVQDPESIPVAHAGDDQTVDVSASVTLDGSRSYDPIGRSLSYSWSVIDKPTSSTLSALTSADSVGPSFVPDVKGVYVLNLVVSNGLASSNSDAVTVTALGDDSAPVSNAGEDQAAEDCTTVQLDCSGSADPDGDTLQYMWEVQAKPSGSATSRTTFSDSTAARPTFYPDVAGEYLLSCAVYDGTTWSTPDTITLVASERATNEAPVITSGTDETVDGGSAVCVEQGYTYDCDECSAQVVTLGSTASILDADGDPMTVLWTTSNSDARITDPTSLVTTVTLEDAQPTEPGECEEVEYEFELTVTDCTGISETDTITLSVNCCGVADTAAR